MNKIVVGPAMAQDMTATKATIVAPLPDEADTECALCLGILVDPVRVPACQHAFCRQCLVQQQFTLHESRNRCPLCRVEHSADFFLVPTDKDLKAASQKLLGAEIYSAKERESEEEIAALKSKHENEETLSVFCLPGGEDLDVGYSLALHFFEKRYVQMTQEAVQGVGQFCYYNRSGNSLKPGVHVMTVKVTQFIERSNGTYDVSARATQQCLVKEVWNDSSTHGLMRVRVTRNKDQQVLPGGQATAGGQVRRPGQALTSSAAPPGRGVMHTQNTRTHPVLTLSLHSPCTYALTAFTTCLRSHYAGAPCVLHAGRISAGECEDQLAPVRAEVQTHGAGGYQGQSTLHLLTGLSAEGWGHSVRLPDYKVGHISICVVCRV
jgi:hypothetical protein